MRDVRGDCEVVRNVAEAVRDVRGDCEVVRDVAEVVRGVRGDCKVVHDFRDVRVTCDADRDFRDPPGALRTTCATTSPAHDLTRPRRTRRDTSAF